MKPTNTNNHACNLRRAWRRTWTLANLANIPVMAAWAYHTNDLQRASLGDPTRPPRAGAPKETLQAPKKPLGTPLITLETLLELKEICLRGFNGDWDLLANYADELGDAQDTLNNIPKAPRAPHAISCLEIRYSENISEYSETYFRVF